MLERLTHNKRAWLLSFGAVGLSVMLAGCSGGGDNSADQGTSGGSSGSSSVGSGSSRSGPPMGGSGPMGGSYGYPGSGPMGRPAAPVQVAGGAPKVTTPLPGRPDPFAPFWPKPKAPPPPPIISLTGGAPLAPIDYRIAPASQAREADKPNDERVVSAKRVAGIMTGANGISALIEDDAGNMTVVKPGDKVGTQVVERIGVDSVTLTETVRGRRVVEVVPMADAVPRATGRPTGGPGVPGYRPQGGYGPPGYGPGGGGPRYSD